jgi:hypothetical protein
MEPIQREGSWWHKQPDGSWRRFDISSGEWQASLEGPPPPPPPPPPLQTKAPRGHRREIHLPPIGRPALMVGAGLVAVLLVAIAAFSFLGGTEPAAETAPQAVVPSPPELSKREQFIYDADQICADIMTQLNQLPTPTTLEGVVAAFETLKDIALDARARGQELDVPRDAKKGWNRLIGTDADYAEIDALIASVKQGDLAAIDRYDAANRGDGKIDRRWAKRYGMKVCSQKLT